MGQLNSRRRARNEADLEATNGAYRYPAKSGGPYFGSHFLMGGERFEIVQPESYLFGDSSDLNFLGAKPVQFPYAIPPSTRPYKPLYCSVVIRRDSLKFVRLSTNDDHASTSANDQSDDVPRYNIEFLFDCDCPCKITVFYYAVEQTDNQNLLYISKRPELTSQTYLYDVGAGQVFRPLDFVFDASMHEMDQLHYDSASDFIPIVVQVSADPSDPQISDMQAQSHALLATVERSAEGHGFVLKVVKQKQFVDGVCYLMQEIYGIENKHGSGPARLGDGKETATEETPDVGMDESSETTGECIVCMSELRDTIILPCRHLCMCSACAETLRYKASNCPICRSPFKALFQIKTLRKKAFNQMGREAVHSRYAFLNDWTPTDCYEFEPIIYALNGPAPNVSTVALPRLTCRSAVGASTPSRRHRPTPPQPASGSIVGAALAATVLMTSSSQPRPPVAVGAHHRAPRPPPRRGHKRKKHVKMPPPIQEVLTPQSLVVKPVEKFEMAVRNSGRDMANLRAVKNLQVAPSLSENGDKICAHTNVPDEMEPDFQCVARCYVDTPTSPCDAPVVDQALQCFSQDEYDDNSSVDFCTGPTVTINFDDDFDEDLKSISSQDDFEFRSAVPTEQKISYENNAGHLSSAEPVDYCDVDDVTVGYCTVGSMEKIQRGGLRVENAEKSPRNDQNVENQAEMEKLQQKVQYATLDETALSSISSTSNSSNRPFLPPADGAGIENSV